MTCSVPPGGLPAGAVIVAVVGGALVERACFRGSSVKCKAAAAPATAAIAAAAPAMRQGRAGRGPSGQVTDVALCRGRRGAAVRLARATGGCPAAVRAAAPSSPAEEGRASGRFSNARRTTSSNATGTPGTSREGLGAAACMCAHRRASSVSRGYATWPVSAKWMERALPCA